LTLLVVCEIQNQYAPFYKNLFLEFFTTSSSTYIGFFLFGEFEINDIPVKSGYPRPNRAQALIGVNIIAARGGDKQVR